LATGLEALANVRRCRWTGGAVWLGSYLFIFSGCVAPPPNRDAEPAAAFAPRTLEKRLSPSEYYPDASKRAHETGEVIIHFHIGANGIAQPPFVVDEKTREFPRLVEAAQKILYRTRYESGERYRHEVTASVLFEIRPCGELSQTPGLDYYYRLCIAPIEYPPNPPVF
jgi:hypothetical protein